MLAEPADSIKKKGIAGLKPATPWSADVEDPVFAIVVFFCAPPFLLCSSEVESDAGREPEIVLIPGRSDC